MLREGMFIAERYEVLEKIGSGGMSDVYRAKCHKLNRYVAIKVLKNEFSEDKTFVAKFRDEAQSAAGLMHANIVNVYDVGEEDGIYYIVMELVEGITLKKYIERKGRLGIRESVSIAIQVAQGMDAAHSHHIVHRDIKPQNIIISKEGKVKVTDFGIARAASSNTINSTVMGSVHYISPEQARGGYSDEKSDIYSFGIMLFEMLTGRVPFEGDTTVAIALQHIQDDIISPKEIISEIPVSVEKIVLKCTQKKTEKRYQNAIDLIADLKRSLVTPDEDFVVIASSVSNDAPTQMIDDDDMAQITQKAGVKSAGPDLQVTPIYSGDYDRKTYEEVENMSYYDDEGEEDDRDIAASKKIDKIIAILGIAVGAVIIIITIIVIVKMVGYFSESSTTTPGIVETTTQAEDGLVEVPNLKGYTYEEAKKILNAAGLGINDIYAHSDSYKEGVIFEQDYEEGQRVKPNTTIRVTISKGAVTFELPSVIGNTQSLAETTLKNKDLKVSYKYEVIETEDLWGTVKSSDPIAGTSVKSGDVITLVIYMGPEVVNEKVPDVVGKTLEEAKQILGDLKFDNITCEYEFDEEVEKDSIVSLSGAQIGEKAPITTPITLVVSKGPEEIKAEIPEDIIGMELEEALKKLKELGFDKVTSTEEYSSDVDAGKVISVKGAKVGDKISVKTEFELVVSKGEEETTTQEPTTEEPTTEAPSNENPTDNPETPSETTLSATIVQTVKLSDIRASFVDADESKSVKLTYYATYKDADGADVVRKAISSPGEYTNYNTMIDSAPFNLNVPVDNVKVGDAVTIEVDITYYKTGQEETTTVTATVVSTFK